MLEDNELQNVAGDDDNVSFGRTRRSQYFFVMVGAAVEIPWYAYKLLRHLRSVFYLGKSE